MSGSSCDVFEAFWNVGSVSLMDSRTEAGVI